MQTTIKIETLITIGFCQPKFYKVSVWAKAKKVMEYLVSLNIGVVAHDFGRGKGKYKTDLPISDVISLYKAHKADEERNEFQAKVEAVKNRK